MERNLILAHDLGTSSDKAVLFDDKFNFIADAVYKYDTFYPHARYNEQDPNVWWEAIKATTKEVIQKANVNPADVKALSFSAQGMATIPIDKDGEALTNRVMIWSDARPIEEAAALDEAIGVRTKYERTGSSFDTSLYPAVKMQWYRHNMPELYSKVYKFVCAKEFIIHKMTGKMPEFLDYSECGISGLFNLETRSWDKEILKAVEVDESLLLTPCESTKIVGYVSKKAAEEMGLCEGVAIAQGSWDNYASATGGGVYQDGHIVTNMGTAGWMGILTEKPLMDKRFSSNVVYAGAGKYFTTLHSNSACVAYDWVLNNMCADIMKGKEGYAKAEKMAEEIAPGADGLFFLPAMLSGNTFYSDSSLNGTYIGLKLLHSEAHLIRAAMEGVGFDLMMISDFYKQMNALPNSSTITGGGAANGLWCKILASMFGIPVERPANNRHIGALGAAIYAGIGSGIVKSYDDAASIIKAEAVIDPVKEWTDEYEKLLPCFRKCYEQILPAYKLIEKTLM